MEKLRNWVIDIRNTAIIAVCIIISFVEIRKASFVKPYDWEPIPNTQQQHYNEKYEIQHIYPPYFDGCSSIKERKFTNNQGLTHHGELNGKGRSWGVHHIKTCLPCQKTIEDIYREVLKESEERRKEDFREVLREIKE